MYSTCIHCHAKLGANESIEHFPVGRKLAFDAARGRLWVVCRGCGRWNLTPLEERWEAIEECERSFRGTRLRMSTENVGLARLREGVELVRIGSPERPEMAAWRYGEQFRRRRRRYWVGMGITAAVGVPLLTTGALSALAALLPGGALALQAPTWIQLLYQKFGIVARGQGEQGESITVRGRHIRQARLVSTSTNAFGWELEVRHDQGSATLAGDAALRVARPLLACINRNGGSRSAVRHAVVRLESEGGAERVFSAVAKRSWSSSLLYLLDDDERLALEMATHEETERQALEGELAQLERDWREAEEIASIADNLLLPAPVREFLARHRRAADAEPA